jgi:formylglycine-generating enzyme required for sulfatase activity
MIPTLSKSGCAAAVFYLSAFSGVAMAQPASIQISPAGNVTVTWNASASGPVNVERSWNLSSWSVVAEGNTNGSFTESTAGVSKAFYRLGKMVFVGGNSSAKIPDLLVSNTETMWGEWKRVRAWAVANGYSFGSGNATGTSDRQPVHTVDWYDTLKWCNARSQMEGLVPVYSVNSTVYKTGNAVPDVNGSATGYRLPTEAEWAWAAGGGVRSQGYTYSGSGTVGTAAWYDGNSGGSPQPVGTKKGNELFLYDMSGNLFEWCDEIFGSQRGVRGGSWAATGQQCQISFGYEEFADTRSGDIGFRIVRKP